MISSKDIFMDDRIREERVKSRMKRTLPDEAYLTIRKEQMILREKVKRIEPDIKHR